MKHLPDERLNKGLLFGAYGLLAISFGLCIFLLINRDIDYPIGLIIVDLLTIIVAFVYFISGYKKNNAKYFKFAMLFKASTYIISFICLAFDPIEINVTPGYYISLAIMFIIYGNTLLVAVGRDLGKIASFLLFGSTICLYIVNMLVSFETGSASEISSIIWILLSLVGLIMIEAKYVDKGNRSAL